jgi:uncharacterized membrane protein
MMSTTLISLMVALHALSAAIWVGGMFFAYMAVRPAAAALLPVPERTTLWRDSFARFFPWVWGIIVVLLATGFWLIFGLYGGMGNVGGHVHWMLLTGLIMMAIYAHIFFSPYRRMRQAIAAQDWPEAGRRLGQIRMFIGINLVLGLITIALGTGGRYW